MGADPNVKPDEVSQLMTRQVLSSKAKVVIMFVSPVLNKSYRVTVRRFHRLMPFTGKREWTAWWATEIVIADCSKRPQKQN